MLNIAIVEDESEAVETLQSALRRYGKERGEAVKTTAFGYAESFLSGYKPEYDIVFMDIMLNGMDGMSAAHKLRDCDEYVPLIFITSMGQFAIDGYSVHAVDYIIKPFEYYDLKMRLDRVLRNIKKNDKYLTVSIGSSSKKLKTDDIYYVETSGHRLVYNTADGVYSSYTYSMKQLERELADFGFARCSVFCLVNMNHVHEVTGNEVTVGGRVIAITRGKKSEFTGKLRAMLEKKG